MPALLSITIQGNIDQLASSMKAGADAVRSGAKAMQDAILITDGTLKQVQTSANAVGRELTAVRDAFTSATPTALISAYGQARATLNDFGAAISLIRTEMNKAQPDADKLAAAWANLVAQGAKLEAARGGVAMPYGVAPPYGGFTPPTIGTSAPFPTMEGAPFAPLPKPTEVPATTTDLTAQQVALATLVPQWQAYQAAVASARAPLNEASRDLSNLSAMAANSATEAGKLGAAFTSSTPKATVDAFTAAGAAYDKFRTDAGALTAELQKQNPNLDAVAAGMQKAEASSAEFAGALEKLRASSQSTAQSEQVLAEAQKNVASNPALKNLQQQLQGVLQGKTNLDQLAQSVNKVNVQFNAAQAVDTAADKALRELQKGGQLSDATMKELAGAINQAKTAAQASGGSWGALMKAIDLAKIRDTNFAFRTLFRDIEQSYPVIGLMINPTATFVRQLDQLVKTGGPLGSVLKSITTDLKNMAMGMVKIAGGIILRDVIELPFRLAGEAIQSAERALTSFIQKGIELNQTLDKTDEEVKKQKAVWDDLSLYLTKPSYDWVISKIQDIGKSLLGAFGSGATWQTGLMSLGSAIGGELQRALSYIYNWVTGIFSGGGPFDPTVWAENAAQLAGEFANGLIEGFTSVVVPAITMIAQTIADFIIGMSPPPLGPLRDIIIGGKNLITDWMQGMLSADFSILDQLTNLVKTRLDAAVASGSMTKEAEASLLGYCSRHPSIRVGFNYRNGDRCAGTTCIASGYVWAAYRGRIAVH